jgi:hypothetical protein
MAVAILSVFILAGCPNGGGTETDPAITGLVITGGTEAVKGTSVQLSAEFTWDQGKANTPVTGVTWSITGQSGNTSITSSGQLNVDSGEVVDAIIVVTATSGDVSGTKNIKVKESTPETKPTVDTVTVTGPASITKSSTTNVVTKYSATVAGNNTPSQNVSWSVDGSPITGVSIDVDGNLTVTPDASDGEITVRATSTVIDYTSISGSIDVEITSPGPQKTEATDFTTSSTNANLLGLYDPSDYSSASAVIAAMNTRATNAEIDPPDATPAFYNPVLQVPDAIDYGTNQLYDHVAGESPGMAWFIYDNELVVYGEAIEARIIFDVAVIKESNGKGWITSYDRTYNTRSETISIADLTGNNFTTTAELTGYYVYIIVRKLPSSFSEDYDFNSMANAPLTNDKNVISIEIPTSP